MRRITIGLTIALGLMAAGTAPTLACAYHDQQASAATQQQTADTAQGATSSTQ